MQYLGDITVPWVPACTVAGIWNWNAVVKNSIYYLLESNDEWCEICFTIIQGMFLYTLKKPSCYSAAHQRILIPLETVKLVLGVSTTRFDVNPSKYWDWQRNHVGRPADGVLKSPHTSKSPRCFASSVFKCRSFFFLLYSIQVILETDLTRTKIYLCNMCKRGLSTWSSMINNRWFDFSIDSSSFSTARWAPCPENSGKFNIQLGYKNKKIKIRERVIKGILQPFTLLYHSYCNHS